ncbi:hypothetical protein Tco_0903789 [Tanacetum coccineum]
MFIYICKSLSTRQTANKEEKGRNKTSGSKRRRKNVPAYNFCDYYFTNQRSHPIGTRGNVTREVFAEFGEVADYMWQGIEYSGFKGRGARFYPSSVSTSSREEGINKIWNGSFSNLEQMLLSLKDLFSALNAVVVDKSGYKHTTSSELQSILGQPFMFQIASAEVGEKLEHAFDLGSDRMDPIVEGGFSSNCSEQDPGDEKDVKSSDQEINGKGDEIICGSPITTGLVGVLLSHNGDGDNNHSDDDGTRESKPVVTVVSDTQKIQDYVLEEVSTDKQLFSNLKVFKTSDDMDSCTNKAQWNKFTPLPPNGLRSSKKAFNVKT